MSNPSQNDKLPANVVFYTEAAADFRRLDRSRKIKVIKALRKIASAPLEFGKTLGNVGGLALVGMRAAYIDSKSVRIVWTVHDGGEIQIVVVAGIAKRDDMYVYKLVASRKETIQEFVRALRQN